MQRYYILLKATGAGGWPGWLPYRLDAASAEQAVEKAKSTDPEKVIAAMAGQTFKAPSGIVSKMDEKNHHLHKSVFIGEIKPDGQFNVVWKTPGPVQAKPWSPFIEGNDKKKDEPEKK